MFLTEYNKYCLEVFICIIYLYYPSLLNQLYWTKLISLVKLYILKPVL